MLKFDQADLRHCNPGGSHRVNLSQCLVYPPTGVTLPPFKEKEQSRNRLFCFLANRSKCINHLKDDLLVSQSINQNRYSSFCVWPQFLECPRRSVAPCRIGVFQTVNKNWKYTVNLAADFVKSTGGLYCNIVVYVPERGPESRD